MKNTTLLFVALFTCLQVMAQEAISKTKEVIWTKIENDNQVQLIREGNHEYILKTPLEIIKKEQAQHIVTYNEVPRTLRSYNIPEIQTDELIRSRLMALNTSLPIEFTPQVRKEIDRLLKDRRYIEETLGRSQYFIPIAEQQLIKHPAVASELKYLPLIESAFKPTAKSPAGARGVWQFMRGTGRMYGLKINSSVDHRLDPNKATEAAFTYLTDLYDIYGDWFLTLAAYNCGPGRLNRSLRASNKENPSYWDIQASLPYETRKYIPKFIAAVYVMSYADQIGLTPNWNEFESVQNQVAQLTGKKQEVIHASQKSIVQTIPENATLLTYTVKHGDNLGFIAEWYDVSAGHLREWNAIQGNLIQPGQKLSIYVPEARAHIYADIDRISGQQDKPNQPVSHGDKTLMATINSNRKFVNYTIQRGDTLWDISRKNGISIDEIKTLNNITNTRNLKPGMVIKIREKS